MGLPIAGCLLTLLLFPSPLATAASVTVTITITVAELGAPSFAWTIVGTCAQTPSSGLTGAAVSVTMNANCAYTINVPADGATQRDRLTSLIGSTYVMTVSLTSCGSGTCPPVSNTAHVEELLTISSNCNGAAVSVASPSGDRWYNHGTSLTVTCNGVWGRSGGVGTRATSWNWDGGASTNVATTSTLASSPQTMSTGHIMNVNTGTQYQLTLDTGALSALNTATGPTITSDFYWYDSGTAVTYTGNGVFGRASGTGTRSVSWALDAGTATTLSTSGTFLVPASLTSAHTVHVTTRAQYQVTLNAGASTMLNSITSPTLSTDNYWYDSGTPVTLALNGIGTRSGGTGTRLVSYAISSGATVAASTTGKVTVLNALAINAPQSVAGNTATQYQLTLDPAAAGAVASITSPSISGDNYWYDSGTQVTYAGNGVFGRAAGTGSRVSSYWVDSNSPTQILTTGTFPVAVGMSSPHSLHAIAKIQFRLALTGSYSPSSVTQPTVSGDNYWYDGGTAVSLSLDGVFGRASGVGQRMVSYSINNGPSISTATATPVTILTSVPITSPQTIVVGSVTQYQVAFDSNTARIISSVTGPTLTGDNYWYDAGSKVAVSAIGVWSRNSTSGYRLVSYSVNGGEPTMVRASGTVTILQLAAISSPQSISSTKVVQYLLSAIGGGGATYSVDPSIQGDTGWYDSGTAVKVSTNATYNGVENERQRVESWNVDGGSNIPTSGTGIVTTSTMTMYAPHTVNFNSVTQYLISLVIRDSKGVTTLSPDNVQLTIGGGAQVLARDTVWLNAGTAFSISGILWHGADVAPTPEVEYTASQPLTVTIDAKVYDAKIIVADVLGFPIEGASATIKLSNGTTIQRTTGSDGSIGLQMIPLGTFEGTASSLGLSSHVSGDASVQSRTETRLALSYPVIAIIVLAVVAIFLAIIVLRRRSR